MFRSRIVITVLHLLSERMFGMSPCPDGYERFDNYKCWRFSSTPRRNWTDASSMCREDGAELARLDSQEEHDYIWNRWGRKNIWLGVNDRETDYQYVDSLGNWLSWENWYKVKEGYTDSNLHCYRMDKNREGRWSGWSCSILNDILCMTGTQFQYVFRKTTDTLLYKEELVTYSHAVYTQCAVQCQSNFDCLAFAVKNNICKLLRSSTTQMDLSGWDVYI